MPIDKDGLSERIDYLVEHAQTGKGFAAAEEVVSGTITILELLYGKDSQKCKSYMEEQKPKKSEIGSSSHFHNRRIELTRGVLQSIKTEIELGFVDKLERQAQGEIFGDFIGLARDAFEDNKDVAAVLACAALEDALKQAAIQDGLDVQDRDMSSVINALISNGKLRSAQGPVAKGYIKLRNKAFHAEWDKIDRPSVSSVIAFTEQFVLENFA